MIVRGADYLDMCKRGVVPSDLGTRCEGCWESVDPTGEIFVWVPLLVMHAACARDFAKNILVDVAVGRRGGRADV